MKLVIALLIGLLPLSLPAALSQWDYLPIDIQLDQPSDLGVDEAGMLWIVDGVNSRIVVLNSAGKKQFEFGKQGAENGEFSLPMAIALAENTVYVADTGNHRIVEFSKKGKFIRNIALNTAKAPEPVALSVRDNSVFWSDRKNHQFCRTALKTDGATVCHGQRGSGEGDFQFPFKLAFDRDGYLHIVDTLNGRVQQFHRNGHYTYSISSFGLDNGESFRPNGLAFDSVGRLFISDSYRGTVHVYDRGKFIGLLSDGDNALKFSSPVDLEINNRILYLVEAASSRIVKYPLPVDLSRHLTMPVVTAPNPARAESGCVSCHFSWGQSYRGNEGVQEGVQPVASQAMCYSCHHGAVIDSRRAIGRNAQHPDVHHASKKSKKNAGKGDPISALFPLLNGRKSNAENLSCGSCHTPHSEQGPHAQMTPQKKGNAWMRVSNHNGDICHKCHESKISSDKENAKGINHPIDIILSKPPLSSQARYAKEKGLHNGLPEQLKKLGAITGERGQMICQTCHKVHGGNKNNLTLANIETNELCSSCHPRQHAKTGDDAATKGIHPINIDLEESVTINGRRIDRLQCTSCHSVHNGTVNTPLLLAEHRDGQLCSACHKKEAAVMGTDHDLRITASASKNTVNESPDNAGVCGSCHSMHRARKPNTMLYARDFKPYTGKHLVTASDEYCLDCHKDGAVGEAKIVEHFSHPYQDMVLRSNPETLPVVDETGQHSEFGMITCSTCHNPHQWQHNDLDNPNRKQNTKNIEGDVLNSFLRTTAIDKTFCADCHGIETRLKYKYYHDTLSRDKGIKYLK